MSYWSDSKFGGPRRPPLCPTLSATTVGKAIKKKAAHFYYLVCAHCSSTAHHSTAAQARAHLLAFSVLLWVLVLVLCSTKLKFSFFLSCTFLFYSTGRTHLRKK
jgi:hypothetical protein